MKYFIVIQDGLEDKEPNISGPFLTKEKATKAASGWDYEDGRIFTVLQQDNLGYFKEVCWSQHEYGLRWENSNDTNG